MPSPAEVSRANEARIAWLLTDPRTASWLKQALIGARERDPVDALNELELLNLVLRSEFEARLRSALGA